MSIRVLNPIGINTYCVHIFICILYMCVCVGTEYLDKFVQVDNLYF